MWRAPSQVNNVSINDKNQFSRDMLDGVLVALSSSNKSSPLVQILAPKYSSYITKTKALCPMSGGLNPKINPNCGIRITDYCLYNDIAKAKGFP